MKITQKTIFYTLCTFLTALLALQIAHAAVDIPGGDILKNVSISTTHDTDEINIDKAREIGNSFLSILKTIVSGMALIYIVLIGVYMVIHSDNEGEVTKQKKQIIYAMVGFLFLNVPGFVYNIILGEGGSEKQLDDIKWSTFSQNSVFWHQAGLNDFTANIADFLRVLIFAVAVIMFTWGAFSLILSRGNDEKKKSAQNRLVYGIGGLIFLGLVEGWSRMVVATDITKKITEVAGSLFGLGFFFAAPVAIFFLMLGAYYYITSGGDEERSKKGKHIIINTGIATLILIASFSFIKELSNFTF